MNQVEFVSLEELVSADHVYRKFLSLLDFEKVLEGAFKDEVQHPC